MTKIEITRRLSANFLRGPDGRRAVFGGATKFQEDPYWRDFLQFYEYFHGDNGAVLVGWQSAPLARTEFIALVRKPCELTCTNRTREDLPTVTRVPTIAGMKTPYPNPQVAARRNLFLRVEQLRERLRKAQTGEIDAG